MKKRLLSLMLAGAMLTGVGTMAACGKEQPEIEQGVVDSGVRSVLYAKNMIVALYEKKIVLHKADIYSQCHYSGGAKSSTTYALNDKLVLYCQDEPVETKIYINYGSHLPSEGAYDELCPECFNVQQ